MPRFNRHPTPMGWCSCALMLLVACTSVVMAFPRGEYSPFRSGPYSTNRVDITRLLHDAGVAFGGELFLPHNNATQNCTTPNCPATKAPVVLFFTGLEGTEPIWTYTQFFDRVVSHGIAILAISTGTHPRWPNPPALAEDVLQVARWIEINGTSVMQHHEPTVIPMMEDGIVASGHSAGCHAMVQGLVNDCSIFSSSVLVDPVDGLLPINVPIETVIRPPNHVNYTMPTFITSSGLGNQSANPFIPSCAPTKLGGPRFYDAMNAQKWYLNATQYGHFDLINDRFLQDIGRFICKSHGLPVTNYREVLSGWVVSFIRAVYFQECELLQNINDPSISASMGVDIELMHDMQGWPPCPKPMCTKRR